MKDKTPRPPQAQYLMSEWEVDRLRELMESFQYAVIELLESRRIRTPPWEEVDHPERENFEAILSEIQTDAAKQTSFDF
jgi:hypothetical protein